MKMNAQRLKGRLDYGHALEFGYVLTPHAGDSLGALEMARLVVASATTCSRCKTIPSKARRLALSRRAEA